MPCATTKPAYSGENLDILTFYQVVGKSLWNVHIWDMIKVQYSLQVHKNIWIYILRLYKLVIFETYILLVKKKNMEGIKNAYFCIW